MPRGQGKLHQFRYASGKHVPHRQQGKGETAASATSRSPDRISSKDTPPSARRKLRYHDQTALASASAQGTGNPEPPRPPYHRSRCCTAAIQTASIPNRGLWPCLRTPLLPARQTSACRTGCLPGRGVQQAVHGQARITQRARRAAAVHPAEELNSSRTGHGNGRNHAAHALPAARCKHRANLLSQHQSRPLRLPLQSAIPSTTQRCQSHSRVSAV